MSDRFPHPFPQLESPAFTLADLPGVRTAGVAAQIKASGKPDVALLVADVPLRCGALFTQNRLAAAPVQVDREHLAKSGGLVRAVVINSGNANAATGAQGMADAREMCLRVATALGCPVEQVLVCSTGVIGRKLPMEKVRSGIDAALASLASGPEAGARFLAAIQTTDAFPKQASSAVGEAPRTAGVCKGAGMIHPDMATMLAFVVTEAAFEGESLHEVARAVAQRSFNAVHVDSHPSTNDTFLLLSTGTAKGAGAAQREAVAKVAHRLAWLIARDGEGATKVTSIRVTGASSDEAARRIADRVAASGLVRTALFGNDPNWGRFVSQVGNAPEVVDIRGLRCRLQGTLLFENTEPVAFDATALSKAMKQEDVLLDLQLADGAGEALLMTSDLGYRYVEVNAEYTT